MLRIALVVLLVAMALGVAPMPSTCMGPSGESCHARDPATDHDGQEPESRRDCP